MKLGTMLSEIPFVNFPIIMKNCGLDFFIVDNEHGAFDYSVLAQICMNAKLCGLEAIVRIPINDRREITKLMDMGAAGLLLSMTNTAEDISKVVEYAKYAPIGKRGISTTRAHTLYNPPSLKEYMRQANSVTKVYAQIETYAGLENIDGILSVNGVDGIFVGPNDLSCDLDCIGNKKPILAAIETVSLAAKKGGKPWGIITTDQDYINYSKENGLQMLSYGSELNMLINECKKIKSIDC